MWQFKEDTVMIWQYYEGDEFTNSGINLNYWKYSGSVRSIYSNKEQQYYSDGENHQLSNGLLYLNAQKRSVEKRVVDWKNDQDSIFGRGGYYGLNKRTFKYTAGFLQTDEKYVYGYYEIKFKMPSKPGFWPAFWLFGGAGAEEIDAMELKTEKRNKIHIGRHSAQEEQNYYRYRLRKRVWGDWVKFKGDLTSGYHVVGVEWDTTYVKYFLNGECIAHTNVEISKPKKIILNIAVPSNGPFKPGPVDTITHSGNFEVDYVRVWKKVVDNSGLKNTKMAVTKQEPSRNIAQTKMVTKDKFIYGQKKEHLGEGIMVEFIRLSPGVAQITVLGEIQPNDVQIELTNTNNKLLLKETLKYGEQRLMFDATEGERLRLEINWKSKKQEYFFIN